MKKVVADERAIKRPHQKQGNRLSALWAPTFKPQAIGPSPHILDLCESIVGMIGELGLANIRKAHVFKLFGNRGIIPKPKVRAIT